MTTGWKWNQEWERVCGSVNRKQHPAARINAQQSPARATLRRAVRIKVNFDVCRSLARIGRACVTGLFFFI